MLQPDLCVVCNKSKLDARGCIAAPQVVVEILCQSNNKKGLTFKFDVYEESGVQEYWVVSPTEKYIMSYTLINGKFSGSMFKYSGDVFQSQVFAGFRLHVDLIFEGLD